MSLRFKGLLAALLLSLPLAAMIHFFLSHVVELRDTAWPAQITLFSAIGWCLLGAVWPLMPIGVIRFCGRVLRLLGSIPSVGGGV